MKDLLNLRWMGWKTELKVLLVIVGLFVGVLVWAAVFTSVLWMVAGHPIEETALSLTK